MSKRRFHKKPPSPPQKGWETQDWLFFMVTETIAALVIIGVWMVVMRIVMNGK